MRWGGGVGDTASMDRSKLLLSDDLLLELETKVRKVFTVPGVGPYRLLGLNVLSRREIGT